MAANQRTSILCIAALLAATACVPDPSEGASPGGDWKSQLIALAPTTGPGRRLEWQRLQWVNNTVDGVLLDHAGPGASERLGGLANISFAYGNPQLTCRMDNSGDRLFCLGRTQEDTVDIGECCGDSLVVYFKDGQEPQEVDLLLEMRWALQSAGDVSAAEAPTVWPSYTFWPFIGNGGAQMVLISFAFESDALDFGEGASVGGADGIHADYGFMVLELNSDIRGRITSVRAVPTKGGSMAIIGFRDLGTTSNDPKDSIYRIQYDVLSRQTSAERLFVTGLISLPLNDGSMSFIAFTNRYQSEVVVLTDPWIIEKPVEIVQRFGTPPILDLTTGEVVGYHFFGIDGDDSTAQTPPRGISNPWHTGYPRLGMDTLTLVANTAADPDVAQVYEVAMRIIPQDRVANLTDEVFRTAYVRMGLDVSIPAMGGARPIDAGLYVVATGTSDEFVGLKVVDSRGGIKQRCLIQSESGGVTGIYDPFVFLSDKPDIHEDLPAIDSPVQKMMRRIRCASRWRCDDA